MANPLQSSGALPPAPMSNPQADSQGAPGAGGPPTAAPAGAPGQQPAPPPPAPTHAQTVATLRHLHTVNGEFAPILQNPDLGKSDLKSQIIDATTKLVAERVVSPAAAVALLSQVPPAPLDQRKWLTNFYQGNERAQLMVLDHHAQGTPASLDWQADQAGFEPHNPDHHIRTMAGVMAHYKERRRA